MYQTVNCALPKGYTLEEGETIDDKFKGTFPNGENCFRITTHKVERLCPCGLTKCIHHVIPTEMHLEGPMDFNGEDLAQLFFQQPVMVRSDVRKWWEKYGLVSIRNETISRTVFTDWGKLYTFPVGHELVGKVKQGTEKQRVQEHFSSVYAGGTSKYKITDREVVQLCPCGKTECDIHVIPSTVVIDSTAPLVLHMKDKVVAFENTFRGTDAMTCNEVRDWLLGYPLKWHIEVTPRLVQIRMLCKCNKPFDITPCKECALKEMKQCSGCRQSFYKKYVKKGLCGNCRRINNIHCPHCNEKVPLAHQCKPLKDMHFSFKFTGVYPPCIRQKKSDNVICPDCNKCMKNRVYHRHQYRAHSDLLPGTGGYSRKYTWHSCPYCSYKNCDITNVREHLKRHLTTRQHECRYGCGATFTRPSAENLHCRVFHSHKRVPTSSLERVGNELVTVPKKRRIIFVS